MNDAATGSSDPGGPSYSGSGEPPVRGSSEVQATGSPEVQSAGSPEPPVHDSLAAPADDPDDLPVDSDVDAFPALPVRPLHLRWQYLVVVAVGGAIGTAAREGLSLVVPPLGSLPLAILIVNLAGAGALGVVLEFLVRHGPDVGKKRLVRLFVGTGFMGGFTTYSTLTTGTAGLLTGGHSLVGIGYALLTLVAGGAASFAGIVLSARFHRWYSARHQARRRGGTR